MMPDAYELKRFANKLRGTFWRSELLDGFEFAPVYYFVDQDKFDSDEVNKIACQLCLGPQRLPHEQTIFEVKDRTSPRTCQIVYAHQRPDGIEAIWLYRTTVGWTDIDVHFKISDTGVAEVETNPRFSDWFVTHNHRHAATGILWRALAILATSAQVKDLSVYAGKRPALAKAGVRGWTYHQVTIDPVRLSSGAAAQGTHASPRWHIRRGHWRTLADGRRVFVRECEVGDATLGGVVKDYVVGQDGQTA